MVLAVSRVIVKRDKRKLGTEDVVHYQQHRQIAICRDGKVTHRRADAGFYDKSGDTGPDDLAKQATLLIWVVHGLAEDRDIASLAQHRLDVGNPVAVPFRRQCHFDNRHPHDIGDLGVGMNPKLGARLSVPRQAEAPMPWVRPSAG